MKLRTNFILVFLAIGLISITSCKDDDPVDDNVEELITTLVYTLNDGTSDVVFTFTDLDGDGGDAPVIINGTLAANTTYTGSMELRNDSENPAEDITEEIEEEDEEHQFFFAVSGANATIAYSDMDADGNPIGLSSTLTTGDASTGTMTITLRHEPAKDGAGVSDGDISNAGGETDIEVTFDVTIQ